jgi:hypothetical protein
MDLIQKCEKLEKALISAVDSYVYGKELPEDVKKVFVEAKAREVMHTKRKMILDLICIAEKLETDAETLEACNDLVFENEISALRSLKDRIDEIISYVRA